MKKSRTLGLMVLKALRTVSDKQTNKVYAKFYNPSEHLVLDEVTVIQEQGYLHTVNS
jgi:hypothetical protein